MKKSLSCAIFCVISFFSLSCDRSSVSLTSVTSGPGSTFIITIEICFGQGTLGAVNGANSETRDFAIGLFESSGSLVVTGYTPATVTGSFTGNTYSSLLAGPQGPPFNTQEMIYYYDPGVPTPYINGLGCISSTAACGTPDTQCDTYTITTNMIPDSLRLFGIEGAGNPIAGCYPNNDMSIDFAVALNVDWGGFYLTDLPEKAVGLNWSTLSETNNDYFIVQKMETLQHAWWDMTIIDGSGNSSSPLNYSYIDPYVSNGINYYRIKQVDLDGKHSYSRTLKVNKNLEGFVPVKIYPTVASNELIIEGAKNSEITFMSIEGIEQERLTLKSNYETLSISEIPEGVYLLQIVNGEKLTIEKIIIQH